MSKNRPTVPSDSPPSPRSAPDRGIFYGLQLNDGQKAFRAAIEDPATRVIISNSVAGSGKTLIALATARLLTATAAYSRVYYVFSACQEAALGYRPGTASEKTHDYLTPLYDALIRINELPDRCIATELTEKAGTAWVVAAPDTFMRGINIPSDAVVIVDECQNFSRIQLKKILSRAGENTKVILIGDSRQTDIPPRKSGFEAVIEFLRPHEGKVAVVDMPVSHRSWLASVIDEFPLEDAP